MDELLTPTDAVASAVPAILDAATRAPQPPRLSTPARRKVVREFRAQVADGSYQPDVGALSSALAAWLLRDGLADLEGT